MLEIVDEFKIFVLFKLNSHMLIGLVDVKNLCFILKALFSVNVIILVRFSAEDLFDLFI